MSLQINQLYAIKSSPTEMLEALKTVNENKLTIEKTYNAEDLKQLSTEELDEIFESDRAKIYNQNDVSILQLSNRHSKVNVKVQILRLSEAIGGMVIVIDHYEGYFTKLYVCDDGNRVLKATSDAEGELSILEPEDERFNEMKSKLEEIMQLDESERREALYNEGLVFASDPSRIFSVLELEFSQLYNPDYEKLEGLLVFNTN